MDKDARVETLLDFGRIIQPRELFPVNEEGAATIIEENPFAFALAAVLDRGTKSEIIWTIPYDLKARIGELTPQLFVSMPQGELKELFRSLPNKPRYITDAPRTVKELAQIVMTEYNGDTEKIWRDQTAGHVKSVFRRIFGVGPGIASMIVLLLEKCYKINFLDLDHKNMDVKPDVHVVRVFRRLGFTNTSDPNEALLKARILNPEYPGALDGPLWIIGKKWCDQYNPKCATCVLSAVCPRNI